MDLEHALIEKAGTAVAVSAKRGTGSAAEALVATVMGAKLPATVAAPRAGNPKFAAYETVNGMVTDSMA
jgi:hypothetical protein